MKLFSNFRTLPSLILFSSFLHQPAEAKDLTLTERASYYEAYAFEAQGNYEKALARISTIYQAHGDDYLIQMRMGYFFSMVKKYSNAKFHYENASQLSPKSSEPWLALSLMYYNLNQWEDVISSCTQVLGRDPNSYYGLIRKISALIKVGQYPEGLTLVEHALQLYPTDPTFLEQRAFILVSQDRAPEAMETLKRLILISPQNTYAKSILKQ